MHIILQTSSQKYFEFQPSQGYYRKLSIQNVYSSNSSLQDSKSSANDSASSTVHRAKIGIFKGNVKEEESDMTTFQSQIQTQGANGRTIIKTNPTVERCRCIYSLL